MKNLADEFCDEMIENLRHNVSKQKKRMEDKRLNPGLVKIVSKSGEVSYGVPNHTPMRGWTDYTRLHKAALEEL